MKLYRYLINVKSSMGVMHYIVLLAPNKKVALKFCKDFDGLKIISKEHGAITTIKWGDEIMQKQKDVLQKGLANNTYEII